MRIQACFWHRSPADWGLPEAPENVHLPQTLHAPMGLHARAAQMAGCVISGQKRTATKSFARMLGPSSPMHFFITQQGLGLLTPPGSVLGGEGSRQVIPNQPPETSSSPWTLGPLLLLLYQPTTRFHQ